MNRWRKDEGFGGIDLLEVACIVGARAWEVAEGGDCGNIHDGGAGQGDGVAVVEGRHFFLGGFMLRLPRCGGGLVARFSGEGGRR